MLSKILFFKSMMLLVWDTAYVRSSKAVPMLIFCDWYFSKKTANQEAYGDLKW